MNGGQFLETLKHCSGKFFSPLVVSAKSLWFFMQRFITNLVANYMPAKRVRHIVEDQRKAGIKETPCDNAKATSEDKP
jgi:hypothetical protein